MESFVAKPFDIEVFVAVVRRAPEVYRFSWTVDPIIIVAVITLVGQWKVYAKAGKPGWACIIPIYNLIVMLEIVGKPIWWIFLFLIPCVNIIFIVWTYNLLSKSFGQSEGFTIGLLLLGY